ncbi:MAG: non-homologous end-joining DNA ligase [Vicinamibacterales bacterium]
MPRSAKPESFPAFIPPMAAQVVDRLPEGDEWIYEVKFDGYRALLMKNGDRVHIRSRNDKDLTRAYPGVRAAGTRLRAETAIIDGEIVAVDAAGRPSFQALQHRSAHPGHTILFFAFDLLYLDGRALTDVRLDRRRARLTAVIEGSGVLLSEELHGTPARIVAAVQGLGLEGVVAKRKDSSYVAGQRGGAWLKLKLDKQQEFVVGGYRPGPQGVDALIVGFYDGKRLRFAAKVRAGFTPRVRRDVFARLRPLHSTTCPFVDLPHAETSRWGGGITAEQMREMQWLEPALVAQVRFVEWTGDEHLRHAAFLGLRDDRRPRDVRRET